MGKAPCCKVCLFLVLIGGLNWGIIGLTRISGASELNLVGFLFGKWPFVENVIYLLVGLAAVAVASKMGKCDGESCK